jgi:hypothetical protein
MSPFLLWPVCGLTITSLVVNAYDKNVSTPSANVVSHLVTAAAASSTATMVIGTMVANTILGNMYDTWSGRPHSTQLADGGVGSA